MLLKVMSWKRSVSGRDLRLFSGGDKVLKDGSSETWGSLVILDFAVTVSEE